MLPRWIVAPMAFAVALIGSALAGKAGAADMKQVPVVRIHAQTVVQAAPSAVWAHLTRGKNLVTWCPVWKSAKNSAVSLAKVGDVLDYTDEWGNGGRSIVTYLAANKELRVAHEPNNGSYLCQAKLILTPQESGTLVHYWEQYTDESAPKDLQATAAKMQAEADLILANLRASVEKK